MKMIKIIIAVGLLTAAISIMYSCKKDETTSPANEKAETSNDTDSYLIDFKKRMSSSSKNHELLSISDAEWHLTALENFELCDASYFSLNMDIDTFYTCVNITNDSISLHELNKVYVENVNSLLDIYHAMDGDDKTIFSIRSKIINDDKSDSARIITTSMMYSGSPVTPNPMRFGPTDYWYDFQRKGKCGEYEGQCIGRDACIEMNTKLQHYIPTYACEEGKRIYFTDYEYLSLYAYMLDDCFNSPYPPYCLYVNNGNSNNCLSPEELNWYLDKILEIIETICEEKDKVLLRIELIFDEFVGVDDYRKFWFWSIYFDIAKANCTQIGAII